MMRPDLKDISIQEALEHVRDLDGEGAEDFILESAVHGRHEDILASKEFKKGVLEDHPWTILVYPGKYLTQRVFSDTIATCLNAGMDDIEKLLDGYSRWEPGIDPFDIPEVMDAIEAAQEEGIDAYFTEGLKERFLVVHGYDTLGVISVVKDGSWLVCESTAASLLSGTDVWDGPVQVDSFREAFIMALDKVDEQAPEDS